MLPERQSKIDTLLKQDGQAYCICRSSDSSRFMIACDACEEWYHGDCINISEKEAKLIRQFFCVRCAEEDPTLVTRWRTKRDDAPSLAHTTTTSNTEERKSRKRKERGDNKTDKKTKKCGECIACYRTEDCGRCDACTRKRHTGGRQKERCRQRVCINFGGNRRKRHDSNESDTPWNAHLQTDYPRQCYGPQCVRSARYGSKYCSDQCGMNLAKTRILQVLPQRLQEWALSPTMAEEKNIKGKKMNHCIYIRLFLNSFVYSIGPST